MKNILKSYEVKLLIMALLIITACSNKKDSITLLFYNGNVVTVDSNNTTCSAIAVKADKIFALGKYDDFKNYISDETQQIDLKGKTVIPGFIESHAHLIGTGKAQMNLNLNKAKNWNEIIEIVKEAVKKTKPGEWILGRGWHQEKWDELPKGHVNGYPNHRELSKVSPDNPVYLSHASGHAVFANKKAMDIAGLTYKTPNPEGGVILKDKKGKPIGIFIEEAENLISKKYQEYLNTKSYQERKQDTKKAIKIAVDKCLEFGITGFHDAGISFDNVRLLKEMVDSNQVKIRLYEMLLEDYDALRDSMKSYLTIGYGNNHLTVRAIKLFADGALGSRGAWLLEPYSDSKNESGLNVTEIEKLQNIAKLAAENNFQVCTHAIGDRANREMLNIYEEIYKANSNKNNFKWRIEHAQHLNKEDIPRFAELGVIPSMQTIHCTSDAPYVEKRLGKRRAEEGAYVWQTLSETGAVICNGTDSPVEDINPFENFYAAVTRKTSDGEVFYGKQKLTRLQALRTMTINGAYAAFEEDIKGSLEVGKLADFVVLNNNLLEVPENQLLETEVLYTVVGGKILYEK